MKKGKTLTLRKDTYDRWVESFEIMDEVLRKEFQRRVGFKDCYTRGMKSYVEFVTEPKEGRYDGLIHYNKEIIKMLYKEGYKPLCWGWEYSPLGSSKILYCTFKFNKSNKYWKYFYIPTEYPNVLTDYYNFVIFSFYLGDI